MVRLALRRAGQIIAPVSLENPSDPLPPSLAARFRLPPRPGTTEEPTTHTQPCLLDAEQRTVACVLPAATLDLRLAAEAYVPA